MMQRRSYASTAWRGRVALAVGGEEHALRTSFCSVATFAWLVVLGIACMLKNVRLPPANWRG